MIVIVFQVPNDSLFDSISVRHKNFTESAQNVGNIFISVKNMWPEYGFSFDIE